MPKLKTFVPYEQEQIEKDMRTRFTGMMSRYQIATELSCNYEKLEEFLRGVPFFVIGKRRKYRIADVAKRIYEGMVYPGGER